MLYQIYNECLELVKTSGRIQWLMHLQELPQTATPNVIIKAMHTLINHIRKLPSLGPEKKEAWELAVDCFMQVESLDLIEQTNMFEDVRKAIKTEFSAPVATRALVLALDPHYTNNDPLAYYKLIYQEYIEISKQLTAIPAANNHHLGPLVNKSFDSAEAILLALLDYAKNLDFSFLEGFIKEPLYKKLQSELAKIKLLDEKSPREQIFVTTSALSVSVRPVLQHIGVQISNTMK